MSGYPIPEHEAERLAALRTYAVLDSPPEPRFDAITRLAATLCDAPTSLITLIDAQRQWCKSHYGTIELRETPRDVAFCAHAIAAPREMLLVPDARMDARFADFPMVAGPPYVRFYAGAPLVTAAGLALGTLCVLDTRPRTLDETQRLALSTLADQVVAQLELHRNVIERERLLVEEQRSSREIRDKSALLAAILDTSVAAIVQLDLAGRIVFANRQGERVLGLHRDAILARSYNTDAWRHSAPDGGPWPDEAQPFRRVLATGEAVSQVEHAIEWPDGRRRLLSVNGAPIRDEHGAITSVVFCVSDVTERRQAEAERRRLEAELQQAQKMEALGVLAGGIAHDFNNLLVAIVSNLALLDAALPAEHPARPGLRDAYDATERARDLVSQILTFSRKQPQPLTRRLVQLDTFVPDALRLIRPSMPAGVVLETTLPSQPLWVLAVRVQLHQVLANLCVNAGQSLRNGAGHIAVGLARVTLQRGTPSGERDEHRDLRRSDLPDGNYACLSVADDGAGMDAATRERIFDPFFTTKAAGRGTGLGLAVVDRIVRGHEGTITVASQPGRGTTFRVYLPEHDPRATADTSAPLTKASPNGKRVLFIDDEPALVRMAIRVLSKLGNSVDGFTDPTAALAAFDAHGGAYDAVLTDLHMPVLGGLSVAAHVSRAPSAPPVVLTSGAMTDDVEARARAAGVAAVLKKPYVPGDLADVLARVTQATSRPAPRA